MFVKILYTKSYLLGWFYRIIQKIQLFWDAVYTIKRDILSLFLTDISTTIFIACRHHAIHRRQALGGWVIPMLFSWRGQFIRFREIRISRLGGIRQKYVLHCSKLTTLRVRFRLQHVDRDTSVVALSVCDSWISCKHELNFILILCRWRYAWRR